MKTLRPYLHFDGDCERALAFYAETFAGHVKFIVRVGEAAVPIPAATEADAKRVLHAEFAAEGLAFMASDSLPGRSVRAGDVVSLNLILDSIAEQDRIWARLSEGGSVTQPLAVMHWGARFGTLVDRFGVPWMLNCELPGEA